MTSRPISKIVHELQSPIMVVRGFLDALARANLTDLDEDHQALHAAALKSLSKIETLLKELDTAHSVQEN